MKQYLDVKLSLKIYLTSVLNIVEEQLCCGLRLRFRIFVTSHENQPAIRLGELIFGRIYFRGREEGKD